MADDDEVHHVGTPTGCSGRASRRPGTDGTSVVSAGDAVFVAKAAHELRSAVCGIEIMATTLADRADQRHGDDDLAVLARQLARQSARVETMARQLLDLHRFEHDGVHLGQEPVNLAELVEGTVRSVPTGPEQSVVVDVADDLTIETDPVALGQILVNLVGNAVRHGGGSVELEGRVEHDRLLLSVVDDGPGIADHLRDRMFEPFVRSTCTAGNGLGLAIVAELTAALNGEVGYEPNQPTGARFSVSLPVS